MLTPSQLSLLRALSDGDIDRVEASIDGDAGTIVYPDAADHLEADDTRSVLEDLAAAGALERTDGRGCTCVLSAPHETIEITLPAYELTDENAQWVHTHVSVRQAVADLLEQRGFDVAVDTTVDGDSGDTYDVHVHATEEVLGIDIVAALAPSPSAEDVLDLASLAEDTGCHPVLVATERPGETIADLAARRDISVLHAQDGDTGEEEGLMSTVSAGVVGGTAEGTED